jgi:hypothetical protein
MIFLGGGGRHCQSVKEAWLKGKFSIMDDVGKKEWMYYIPWELMLVGAMGIEGRVWYIHGWCGVLVFFRSFFPKQPVGLPLQCMWCSSG